MLRAWWFMAWAGLLACEAPAQLPWPDPAALGRARAAILYGIEGGEVRHAVAVDLQLPPRPLTMPDDLEAQELSLYPCELSALGLVPGAFPDLAGTAPPARRRLLLTGASWQVGDASVPRPWPSDAPPVSPCWTFPEPETILIPGPADRRMLPSFMAPWVGDRWLMGVRGVPLQVLTIPADPQAPVGLVALPGPVDVVAGFTASPGTAYVLDFSSQLHRVQAQGEGAELTPLATIPADDAHCRAEGRRQPLEVWSMDGRADAEGELEIVASNNCGGIYRYRTVEDVWTTVRPTDVLEMLLYLDDSTAVRSVGTGEFLVAVAEYGLVTRVRGGRLEGESFGDDLAVPLTLVQHPDGQIYLGTDTGELRRRGPGGYELVGRAPPGGIAAAAPLARGWVLGNDVPNGGRQLQPGAPGFACEQPAQRPGQEGGFEIHHLVWAGQRLFALLWQGELTGSGRVSIYRPTETTSSVCFDDL